MGKRRLTKATGPHDQLTTSRIVIYRQLRTDRLHIFYSEAGMGPPVILIHGLGASSRWWFPLYPQLSSDNFRALAPDLPGFGRSPGPPLPLHRAGRSVIEFADRIGLGRFFLCGHSMGGVVAAHIAAEYGPRVRRLVLIDSAGIPANHTPRVIKRLLQPWSWCPLRFYPTLVKDMLRAGPRSLVKALRYTNQSDIREELRRIQVPTLVIWGEKDRLLPLKDGDRLVSELGDARLETIAGARHIPMVSHPARVARLMVDFFGEDLVRRS